MKWQKLYSSKRYGSTTPTREESGRGEYIKDYDRVIFSSPFRKLQNKTQVFPLPGTHFVHNRLTHSLEVASVGRSLGKLVGEKIAHKYESTFNKQDTNFYRFELSDVIQTACLAHDIGNPPYGHFGEEAIRAFFVNFFKKNPTLNLTETQERDFTKFEGNANAFRILTSLFRNSGLKMTYTTLASVVKYPTSSLLGFNDAQLATKKSGFMASEIEVFKKVAQELEIPGDGETFRRHPFVFLVEAADDICYKIIDLEDAFKLNIINFQEIKDLLLPLFINNSRLDYLENKLNYLKDQEQAVSLLRAFTINLLVEKVSELFIKNEDLLLSGTLNHSLVDLLDISLLSQVKKISQFSVKRIYNHTSVIEKELAGHHIIFGLLEEFCNALLARELSKSKKVLQLLPTPPTDDIYVNIQLVTDFISQMSDEYAMELFRKLKGVYSL